MTGATLLAIFKAIPALQKMFEEAVDLYLIQQSAADQGRYQKKKAQRDAIIAAMLKPGVSNEDLRELRHALYELNNKH